MLPPKPAQCLEGSFSCTLAPLACSHPVWTEDACSNPGPGEGQGHWRAPAGFRGVPFWGASPGGVEKEKLRGIPVRVGGRKDDLLGWVSEVTGKGA